MKTAILALAAGAGMLSASSASATTYIWNWNQGDGGVGVSNAAGTFKSVTGSYDSSTSLFTWDVTFDDQVTEGYTLAVSPGANPKGHAGELALIYFDASNLASPEVTVYAYNGQNSQLSWADGSPAAGVQSPDKILSTQGVGAGDILSATVSDAGGDRTFSLVIDATNLNSHSPKWPGPGGDSEWTGVSFADALGVWMHPVLGLSTNYGVDGFLNGWYRQTEGYFDGEGFATIPTPAGSLALGGLGLMAARRRRR